MKTMKIIFQFGFMVLLVSGHPFANAEVGNNNGARGPASVPPPAARRQQTVVPGFVQPGLPPPREAVNQSGIATAGRGASIEDTAVAGGKELHEQSGKAYEQALITCGIGTGMILTGQSTGNGALEKAGTITFGIGVAIGLVGDNQKKSARQFDRTGAQVRVTGPTAATEPPDPEMWVPCPTCDEDGDGDNDTDDNRIRDRRQQQITTIRRNAKAAGIKIDTKKRKITFPDGKTLDIEKDFKSAAALKAAGFSSASIAAAQAQVKAAADKAAAATDSTVASTELFDGDIGGGKSAGSGYNAGYGDMDGVPGPSADAVAGARAPASVQGLSQNFNGEPIGVAGTNIWITNSNRYDFHEDQGHFLSPVGP